MKNFLTICLTIIAFNSCVKDPSDISPSELFDVKVNDVKIQEATIVADNSIKYKVILEALKGIDIENEKQVTVSVSDGTLAPITSLSSAPTSTQISVTIEGGKGVFYYSPGKKAQNSALMSITLQGISQVIYYEIKPSEPIQIQLSFNPSNPKIIDNVEVTAFLIKNSSNNSLVSNDLKVYFKAEKFSSADIIEPFIAVPGYSSSVHAEQTGFITAKTILTDNNKKPGKVSVTAKYTKVDGSPVETTSVIEFTQ